MRSFEPAVLAPTAPARAKPTIVMATIERVIEPTVGANAPINGMRPPMAKEIADAIEA
jgi:hypothetical protein